MRLPVLAVLLSVFCAPASSQIPAPDAAPSIDVETLTMPAFEPTREDAVMEAFVDGVVGAHMREHGAPAVSVAVVRDGRTVFAKTYGLEQVEPRTPARDDTLFRIGSISKTFIWTSMMMLVERGMVDLDADVNNYLTEVRVEDAFGAPVQVKDLISHRAGFEDSIGVFTLDPTADQSLAQALNDAQPRRVMGPGSRVSYSNWGAALSALIVENASGVSYAAFLQREILGPLGMTATLLQGPDDSRIGGAFRHATGYKADGAAPEEITMMHIGAFAPAGAMSMSAGDAAKWMLFHLGKGALGDVRLMRPETHDAMWSRVFDDLRGAADVAHGFQTTTYRGEPLFSHGGATLAFYANMAMAPGLDFGVYVSQNAADDRALVSQLPFLLLDRMIGDYRAHHTPLSDGLAEDYEGVFLNNRRPFTRFEKVGSLGDAAHVRASDDGALIIEGGGRARKYWSVAPDVFEDAYGARLAFGRDSADRVSHFTDASGVHSYERAGVLEEGKTFAAALGAAAFFSASLWLGAWRRQGRAVSQEPAGRYLNASYLGGAVIVFGFLGAFALTASAISALTAENLAAYPPAIVHIARLLGVGVFAVALVAVGGTALVWLRSGWGIARKAHYTLFAASLAFLAFMLVWWRVIFSATS